MGEEVPFDQNQFIPNLHDKTKHRRQHMKQTTSSHHIVPQPNKAQFSPTQPSTSQLHQNEFIVEEKMMSKGLVFTFIRNINSVKLYSALLPYALCSPIYMGTDL